MPYVAFIGAFILSGLMFRFRLRGGRSERPWLTAVFVQLCALILGVLMSKAVYVLCQVFRYGLSPLFSLDINRFSFVGFAAGTLLGARLFMNMVEHTSHGSVPMTNLYAPCWAMLLALVRAGEYFFAKDGLTGVGADVEIAAHSFFPAAISYMASFGEVTVYAIFMLECFCSLLVCAVALVCQKIWKNSYRDGFAAERIAFYLALLQIFCQRLLKVDGNMWAFVPAEQVLCAIVIMFLLLRYAWMTRRLMKADFAWSQAVPAIIGFVGIVIIGLAEFAMDKPYMFWDIPQNVCLYILIGGMALIAVMEVIGAQRRKAALARA